MIIKGKWFQFESKLDYNIINFSTIELVMSEFKKEVLDFLDEKDFIYIQLRMRSKDHSIYRSISYIDKIIKKDFEDIVEVYKGFWELKENDYKDFLEEPIIIIAYHVIPTKYVENSKSKIYTLRKKLNLNKEVSYKGYNLPNTADYSLWGYKLKEDNPNKIIVLKKNSSARYEINKEFDKLKVDYVINNRTLFSFIDEKNGDSWNKFTRFIFSKKGKYTYGYENNGNIFKSRNINFKYLKKLNIEADYKSDFITMDLESRVINNTLSIYCCSIYDGKILTSFYLTDYESEEIMLKSAVCSLLLRKYRGWNVYFHNFSNFDVIFLINILSSLSFNDKISLILNNGDFISLKLYFSNSSFLNFKDSYLLLPNSLKDLANYFKVENKGKFPFNFVKNNNIDLNYIGNIPSIDFFDNFNLDDYKLYVKSYENNNWNLKRETIKYCEQDVKILHNIISKFNLLLYRKYRINPLNYPTLPSLSFAIYRSRYLKEDYNIPIITGEIYSFIKKGYYGGAIDVYKPYSKGKKIYRYDVNSLYPYIMYKFDMPVGKGNYFEGNIFDMVEDPFGFFEVEVETTCDLDHPILLYHGTLKNNYRTIAPLGRWKGVYFSEEIKNAMKYGYKFKIIRGYTFEKKNIFKEYVTEFYNLKSNSSKDDPMYTISKYLLNSLYGRFGMSPYKNKHKIIHSEEIYDYSEKYNILSMSNLENNKIIISYKENIIEEYSNNSNVNIAIAASVTAYARIFMSQFKNTKKFDLYYSDTDSIDIDCPLPEYFIGKELGKMKLEYIFDEAVYIAPKVYGGINKNQEIIKIKGSKKKISFQEMKSLLIKGTIIEINHEKWYKNLRDSNITLKNEIYSLIATSNKRELLYDDNNIFINTKPFIINEI